MAIITDIMNEPLLVDALSKNMKDMDLKMVCRTSKEFKEKILNDGDIQEGWSVGLFKMEDIVVSVSMLQWAVENGCPRTEELGNTIALGGHWDVLVYAEEIGIPYDPRIVGLVAANCGNRRMIEWAHDRGCKIDYIIVSVAARGGHLDVIEWMCSIGATVNSMAMEAAAMGGQLRTLEYLHSLGCAFSPLVFSKAAERGDIQVLAWLKQKGCPWNEYTCSSAASRCNLHALQWLRLNGCPWDVSTMMFAAKEDCVEILSWARAHGCPWSEDVPSVARLNAIRWLLQNGCPFDYDATLSQQLIQDHDDVIEWLENEREALIGL
jgi:hypothetical protein